jgi:tRNA-splicing ligase RtcB (3'-phosphate/5'-hydroxy nucleic acid ligase)
MVCGKQILFLIFKKESFMNDSIKKNPTSDDLIKVDEAIYEIPKSFRSDMNVPARIFVNESLLDDLFKDRSLQQIVNVATLPGIVNYALAMPDIHEGYGFPIGGVAATNIAQGGVISPGGIGYDINCGVRLLTTDMSADEARPLLPEVATEIFNAVPSGVGRGGKLKLSMKELDKILQHGVDYMLERGFGIASDKEFCEEQGCMKGADPSLVSDKAKQRGHDQLGTLGSGNHFLEIQKVEMIFDPMVAEVFGLKEGMITIMIHCGSRGLGHQVCTDYVREFMPYLEKWGIQLPDRELVCAPFTSAQGQEYYKAMQAAANFAWANRHMIGHSVRQAWKKVFGDRSHLRTMYDVSHNIGKEEIHRINGKDIKLMVHRKGATRAFGPERPEVPALYRHIGQPVLIPGTMGTASYVLVGTSAGMDIAFGTSCHGAGRRMSRMQAKKQVRGSTLREMLEKQGIIVRCESDSGLAEEAPTAYKDVEEVVDVVESAHLATKVARLIPLAVIKGG